MSDDTTYLVAYEDGVPVGCATAPSWHKKAVRAFIDVAHMQVVSKAEYDLALSVIEDAAAQDGGGEGEA